MTTRLVHIFRRDTYRIEILDARKLAAAWKQHRRITGLDMTKEQYLAGMVHRVETEGFKANDHRVTGFLIRPEDSAVEDVVV